ncbi:MAG TPA: sensor histidine kinase [Anaerolineae bacterium]|nr:sensor histidine kinase [Anaerolineae bacterium]
MQRQPLFIVVDLLFVAGLVALSGGWQSAYYLYTLSPLIVAAFFFQLRGVWLTTAAFLPLYIAAVLFTRGDSAESINWVIFLTQGLGIVILASTFGYVSSLLQRLRLIHHELLLAQDEMTAQVQARAIETERLRIARDMHDTVSQSLFGLSLALKGIRPLIRTDVDSAEIELVMLSDVAETVRNDVRELIFDLWPNELTAERFSADLNRYMRDLTGEELTLDLDIRGDFSLLSPNARRSIYRICQESLANIANHAQADQARVCLDIEAGHAKLLVRDNGIGFKPELMYDRGDSAEHFGLRGMEERTHALGGTFDVFSRPQAGTSVVVEIPVTATI